MADSQECMIFIDDSNIWIEAQKFSAKSNPRMPRITDADHDPRLRINIGKLIKHVGKGRERISSYLYGSRPPPNDSVWDAFRKEDFVVRVFDRSAVRHKSRSRGKEKEVDNAMSVDITDEAAELRIGAKHDPKVKHDRDRMVFLVISGDRDMLPAVRAVLNSDIMVEVWAWRSSLSPAFRDLSIGESRLEIKFLDDIFEKLFFVELRSTRKAAPDPTRSIMLEATDAELDYDVVCDGVKLLGKIFFTRKTGSDSELIVEFYSEQNMDLIITRLRGILESIVTVTDWPTYSQRRSTTSISTSIGENKFALVADDGTVGDMDLLNDDESLGGTSPGGAGETLRPGDPIGDISVKTPTVEWGSRVEEPSSSEPADTGAWTVVTRQDNAYTHYRKNNQHRYCPYGIRCAKRGQCSFRHTRGEHNLFNDPGNAQVFFPAWKSQPCRHGDGRCYKTRASCPFYHSLDEAWCRGCKLEGHFTLDCQFMSAAKKDELRRKYKM